MTGSTGRQRISGRSRLRHSSINDDIYKRAISSSKGRDNMDAPRQLYNRERDAMSGVRALADQAFSRAAGAPLIEGNTIRLLNDARENYPAWLDAISAAKRCVHFENYIIRDDEAGRMFAEALVAKAQAGVRVRVMYDWLGGRNTSRAFWNRLRASGVDVRCYNPRAGIRRSAGSVGTIARRSRWTVRWVLSPAYASGGCGSVCLKRIS